MGAGAASTIERRLSHRKEALPSTSPVLDQLGSIGPLGVLGTRWTGADLRILESTDGHYCWSIDRDASLWSSSAKLKTLYSCIKVWPLQGFMAEPVALSQLAMEDSVNIQAPFEASHYSWAHKADVRWKDDCEACVEKLANGHDADVLFILHGGFLFTDKEGDTSGVNTISPAKSGNGMCFGPPTRALPSCREALRERFKDASMKEMRDAGVSQFCWIGPNESVCGGSDLPPMPLGGFAYLVRETVSSRSASTFVETVCVCPVVQVRPTRDLLRPFLFVTHCSNVYREFVNTPFTILENYIESQREEGRLSGTQYFELIKALSSLSSQSGPHHSLTLENAERELKKSVTVSTLSPESPGHIGTHRQLVKEWLDEVGIKVQRETEWDSGVVSRKSTINKSRSTSLSEGFGIDSGKLVSLSLDAFALPKEQIAPLVLGAFGNPWVVMSIFNINTAILFKWVNAIGAQYKDVPYHCWAHAVDVLQMCYIEMLPGRAAETFLSDLDILVLLVSALGHDVAHPGMNNSFLCRSQSPLAITYNDVSVLENMHTATLFQTLYGNQDGQSLNFLRHVDRERFAEFRDKVIYAVLNTDMSHHARMVDELRGKTALMHATAALVDDEGDGVEASDSPDSDVKVVLAALLHFADISSCARPPDVFLQRSNLIEEEFFRQGDCERELGLPISPMMDRQKDNLLKGQVGFIDFVVAPLFQSVQLLVPGLNVQLAAAMQRNKEATKAAVAAASFSSTGLQ